MNNKTIKEINENEITYVVETYLNDNGEVTHVVKYPKPSEVTFEPIKSEPSQLDRIESMVAKSQEEIAQEARDAYTLELINSGII